MVHDCSRRRTNATLMNYPKPINQIPSSRFTILNPIKSSPLAIRQTHNPFFSLFKTAQIFAEMYIYLDIIRQGKSVILNLGLFGKARRSLIRPWPIKTRAKNLGGSLQPTFVSANTRCRIAASRSHCYTRTRFCERAFFFWSQISQCG